MRKGLRCKRADCIYKGQREIGEFSNGCDYSLITGKSRIAQLPPDMRAPAKCPFYVPGEPLKRKPTEFCLSPGRPRQNEWEPKAMELYKSGHNDAAIARLLDISLFKVSDFRHRNGLPRIRPKVERFRFDQKLALKMYRAGKSDSEIGSKVGAASSTILKWRHENCLPPNVNIFKPGPRYDWEKARQLYEQGCTDKQIAEVLGCYEQTVGKWRKKNNLPSKHKKQKGGSQ